MSDPKRLSVPTNPALALRHLNREQAVQSEEENNNTTILQSDKPTNNDSDTQTDQHSDKPALKHTDRPTDSTTDQPTKRQTNKPKSGIAAAPSRKQIIETAPVQEPDTQKARIDGRTLRPRQDTADRTMVTSLRLAVTTVDQLDEYCWRNRQRKQDVIQAALTLYFETMAEDEI